MDLTLLFARPWALWASALALLVLWRARRSQGADALYSGTLELWRDIARTPPSAHARGRRVPPAARWTALALLLGALAAAGPRASGPAVSRTWTLLVDTTPSLYLPWSDPERAAEPGAPARLERALAVLAAEFTPAPGERLRWLRVHAGRPEEHFGRTPPLEWLSAPRVPQEPPPWAHYDDPGTLWVSDEAEGHSARSAGTCLVGGGPAYGAVAALGEARLDFGATGLVLRARAARRPRAWAHGDLPPSLLRLLAAWCAAREVEWLSAAPADGACELELSMAAGPAQGSARSGARDGWTWACDGPGGVPQGSAWLSDALGALVAWSPGRVELAGAGWGEPRGDVAAWAASWSGLLDAAALPAPGVVASAERLGARASGFRAPQPGPTVGARTGAGHAPLLAGLGALAACAALVSSPLRSRRLRRSAA